jgi:hypothetical protein
MWCRNAKSGTNFGSKLHLFALAGAVALEGVAESTEEVPLAKLASVVGLK